jgi:hypothetical protein
MDAYVLNSIGVTRLRRFPTKFIIDDFFFESNTYLVEFVAVHHRMNEDKFIWGGGKIGSRKTQEAAQETRNLARVSRFLSAFRDPMPDPLP